jgi:enoyl-CoA hydratase/carnithine racemase
MSEPLLIDRAANGVVTLTFNRPDIRNAMDLELTEAFSTTVSDLRTDESVRAVVITGAGSAFCAGGDLSWIKPGPEASVTEMRRKMRAFYPKFLGVRNLEVPVIAAINGPAVGAGACVAMACDIRLISSKAFMSLPFARLGMHPGMAASYLLTHLVGSARAAELLYTARKVQPAEAERIGLVNQVVEDDVLAAATRMAETIVANAPIPISMTKRSLLLAERLDIESMLEIEGYAQPITMGTNDLQEGLAATRERRDPEFKGN